MRDSLRPLSLWIFLGIALIAEAAAIIWAPELRALENRTLDSLGVPAAIRVLILAGLVALFLYRIYCRSKREAMERGQPAIRRWIVLFAAVAVASIATYIYFVASSH